MHTTPLIAVTDVEASSRWYQQLLELRSDHGGPHYERLVFDGRLILQLHSFETVHDHGPIGDRHDRPHGNGVLLWIVVDDFEGVLRRAAEMKVEIVLPKRRNDPAHWECWMRDPDGYVVVVASPDGSAESEN